MVDFDKAQEEGHKAAAADEAAAEAAAAEKAAAESEVSSPNEGRKTRFNTLTKSIRKAFTKKKKSKDMLKLGGLFESESGSPWPEDKNPYSELTVADLVDKEKVLGQAQSARVEFYEKELSRWQENDAACKAYSDAVSPAQSKVKELTVGLMANAGSDEDQLAETKSALDVLHEEAFKLPEYEKLSSDVQSRGITSNPYTTLTIEDLKCELDNVQQIAQQKRPYLESTIAFKKYKGISPEQYDLMETLFKDHDADGSNSISPKELRACLFSLGEERSKVEIKQYIKDYGKNNALNFEQFRELMIVLIGDTGNKESTVESFKLIARGLDYVLDKDLTEGAPAVPPSDVAYFVKEAPEKEGGHEYMPWIDAVFAR
jgi:Ca2+-binding EF-hand superfamily protein